MPTKYDLEGKVALITGASRGIGKEYALTLARNGASIVVNYSASAGPANALVETIKKEGGEAIAVQANISSVPDIARLFDEAKSHFGKIDIVISNAGVEHFGDLDKVTEEEFDKTYNINTRGQFFVAQQAYKHITHNGGRLILTSSVSKGMSIPRHSVYASSKGAIESMVRNLAADFGPLGVTVNAVAPGGTVTDMAAESARDYMPKGSNTSDEEVMESMKKMSPLGRAGQPQDIANVVAFLASKEGEWMNGQTVIIAG